MMKVLSYLAIVGILMSMVPTVAGAPVTHDKNTILCDRDFAFANSLSEAEIQAIFDARNSFFKDYIDPATSQRASWVIADRAQQYQISSRVLLAKMQAESSSVWAYRDMNEHIFNKDGIDMGTHAEWVLFYGWSDTTIYPQYKGFYNQVDNAAKSLSEWFSNPNSKGWTVGQSHPVSDGTVTPTNRATAALYIYTPWISSNKLLYNVWKMMFGDTGACLPSTQLNIPPFNQNDEAWHGDQLGTCPNTYIGNKYGNDKSEGCAVTSLAMVLKYFGMCVKVLPEYSTTGQERVGMNPSILNDQLTWKGGYANRCLMAWTVLPPSVTYTRRYNDDTTGIHPQTYANIDNALANDDPVIAGVHWSGKPENSHFVVITGRNGDTYNIIDPWGGVATTLDNGALGHYIIDHYRWFSSSSPIAVEKGLCWLRTTQNPDGSWSSDVGVTSLAAICFMNAGYDETDPDVRDAIGYIYSKVHDEGDGLSSIWSDGNRKTYHTSLATLALVATHNDSYDATIDNAAQWLKNSQWDEDCLWGTVNEANWYYGGFGYGYHIRPDNSNTQFALMALDAVQSTPKDDPLWDKAQIFLNRVQARDISNDQPWANGRTSGGFIYTGNGGTAGSGSINGYGSMTGAGIWGLMLSNAKKDDPRVKAALNWTNKNYMWDGNPGMGTIGAGQYYYYLSMSKALTMIGDSIGGHDWYQDLSNNLTSLQKPEGYWVNDRSSWAWEDNKDLVTSYAILSLQTRGDIPEGIQRLSWLTFVLHSNADLHVYDPLGRHVGKNYEAGGVEIGIPNATYSEGSENITIHKLIPGNYRIVLTGTGTGEYTLNVTGGVGDDIVAEDSFTSAISKGEVHDADVNVAMITWLTIHIEEPDPIDAMVESATGTGNVSFVTDAGTIEDLTALNESDLPEENPNVDFPHGLFSFNITGLSNGETVNVTINFPEDIPTTAQYWKYNTSSGEWYQIPIGSNDGDNIITIMLQDGGIGDNDGVENGVISDPGAPGVPSAQPTAASSSITGAPIDLYRVDADVYATGSGFTPGTNVDIYVVPDQNWNDNNPIPSDVTGAVETVSVVNGAIATVLVWHAPLVIGEYDIVIDANQNGVYDAATDGLDSGSPGFVVIDMPSVPVPALAPIGIIALIGLLCVIGVSRLRRGFN